MKSIIYPFTLNRDLIPIENSGYPVSNSHIFTNRFEDNNKKIENHIEINIKIVEAKYPEITIDKLAFIVQNIVEFKIR